MVLEKLKRALYAYSHTFNHYGGIYIAKNLFFSGIRSIIFRKNIVSSDAKMFRGVAHTGVDFLIAHLEQIFLYVLARNTRFYPVG